jgi:hypothetical protein
VLDAFVIRGVDVTRGVDPPSSDMRDVLRETGQAWCFTTESISVSKRASIELGIDAISARGVLA